MQHHCWPINQKSAPSFRMYQCLECIGKDVGSLNLRFAFAWRDWRGLKIPQIKVTVRILSWLVLHTNVMCLFIQQHSDLPISWCFRPSLLHFTALGLNTSSPLTTPQSAHASWPALNRDTTKYVCGEMNSLEFWCEGYDLFALFAPTQDYRKLRI